MTATQIGLSDRSAEAQARLQSAKDARAAAALAGKKIQSGPVFEAEGEIAALADAESLAIRRAREDARRDLTERIALARRMVADEMAVAFTAAGEQDAALKRYVEASRRKHKAFGNVRDIVKRIREIEGALAITEDARTRLPLAIGENSAWEREGQYLSRALETLRAPRIGQIEIGNAPYVPRAFTAQETEHRFLDAAIEGITNPETPKDQP